MEHIISLNPKKSILYVIDSRFLGHLVIQEGIKIDPKHVKDIQHFNFLGIKFGVKSFFG